LHCQLLARQSISSGGSYIGNTFEIEVLPGARYENVTSLLETLRFQIFRRGKTPVFPIPFPILSGAGYENRTRVSTLPRTKIDCGFLLSE